MLRIALIVSFVVSTLLCAPLDLPFQTLAEPLQKSAESIERLRHQPIMQPNEEILKSFLNGVDSMRSTAGELAKGERVYKKRLKLYLHDLRELSQQKEAIEAMYRQSLSLAMNKADKKNFEALVSIPLESLHQPRVRSEVIAFYQKNYPLHTINRVDALCDEAELETKSMQLAIEQEQAYEEHLRTLKRSEAKTIKRDAKIGSRNSVIVVKEKLANGQIVFDVENLNPYMVTLALDFEKLVNLKPDHPLPLYVELSGKSKKEVLTLTPIDTSAVTDEASSYGWVKGSAFAKHDDDYVYRLPFSGGKCVEVSQGYNGAVSHKGLSAYAVDFAIPIGTPIYAAREGEIVGVDVSHDLGGASPEYRPYMNYINIKHSDGTLGNYFHLKLNGSVVKIGQKIKRGDLIGYSGSTGYCTAPHLHFSVSTVDPVSMRRPMNLPIKMQTLNGIVMAPRKGDRYTVQ
ncbi:MAG: M23 family metallopeptidase [Sulfuricurvum sp.]|uniref:M23 family metallopeptidase n=1 Tax=Sulfuricurvum sp. TaxID=2025608 RepID=UPI0025CE0770|nr:M23 family metallopeptidase [Sulfuricurvum sp.]MCK9372859.1 M23 family metallopeptidase [Sulfuricurvum sp.]